MRTYIAFTHLLAKTARLLAKLHGYWKFVRQLSSFG